MGEKKYNFEDDQSVADMLGSLPRAATPANFDARVRSRIARGRPSSGRRWLIPSAAAMSLCAVVLAVAFVYLRDSNEPMASAIQSGDAPAIVSESPNLAVSSKPEPANETIQPGVSEAPANVSFSERRDAPISKPRPVTPPTSGGGFFDKALRQSEAPRVPIGMPTPGATPEANVKPPGPVNKVSAREILQMIGLDAEFRDGGWLVKKVAENSLTARSGVREGDIIEAIDDTKIMENTTFENGFSGNALTLVRGGIRQIVSMRNR